MEQSQQAYDPNKACGDYGGVTWSGKPCKQPAGWQNPDPTDPRCDQHSRVAEEEMATKKARALELLPASGNIKQVGDAVGATPRVLFAWRRADPEFREAFDSILESRDKGRVAEVEDKVFERIMADKASPAETIFYLKNRDPDRWRDVYRSREEREAAATKELAPVDSAKARLSKRLRDMAKRTAEGIQTQRELSERQAAEGAEVARAAREGEQEEEEITDDGEEI